MLHKIAHSNVSSYSKDYFYYYFLHSLLSYCPFSFGALPRIPPKTSRANEISNFQQKLSPLMEDINLHINLQVKSTEFKK